MPEVVSLGLKDLIDFFSIKLPNLPLFCVKYDLVGWCKKSVAPVKKEKKHLHIVKGLFRRIYAQKANTGQMSKSSVSFF